MKMKRIVFVISSLGMGGAESVMTWLARELSRKGNTVTVLTLDDGSVPPFLPLPAEVRHVPLGVARDSSGLVSGLRNNIRRVSVLRRAILAEMPDVVVSFMSQTNILTLLAAGRRCPVIVSERTQYDALAERVWRLLRRWLYGRAASVVVQTEGIRRCFSWIKADRLAVIPNAVRRPECFVRPDNPLLVLGLGRLHHVKGFDLLLRAFADVSATHPEWRLVVHGEGPARAELENLTRTLGLEGSVSFPGRTEDAHAVLAEGSVFVLPSRWEGFPNALGEAMSVGLPCIASDCPGGPADLISDGKDGLLVPVEDVEALASALRTLMDDETLRERLGMEARSVVDRFGEERVLSMWTECIDAVIR